MCRWAEMRVQAVVVRRPPPGPHLLQAPPPGPHLPPAPPQVLIYPRPPPQVLIYPRHPPGSHLLLAPPRPSSTSGPPPALIYPRPPPRPSTWKKKTSSSFLSKLFLLLSRFFAPVSPRLPNTTMCTSASVPAPRTSLVFTSTLYWLWPAAPGAPGGAGVAGGGHAHEMRSGVGGGGRRYTCT